MISCDIYYNNVNFIMKKIIINESKRDVLLSAILNESLLGGDQSDKVLLVKDFLDKNFSKASSNNGLFDENGNRKTDSFVALLDNSKNVLKLLTDKRLIYCKKNLKQFYRTKQMMTKSNEISS